MPTDDQQVLVTGIESAPASFTIPGNGQIRPKTIYAKYNGASAGTPYSPALKITSDGGELIGIYATCQPVAAGGSANVTWFPEVDDCCGQSQGGGGSGTIQSVTSPTGTLLVTSPSGPITNVDMPATGVSPGTYGDATRVPQVTVDAEGRVTAASQINIGGISGTGLFKLFDSTLGVAAASIGTGANGIAAAHADLLVYLLVQTADAGATGGIQITFNGDTGTNYDVQYVQASNLTVSAGAAHAQNNFALGTHGGGGTSGYPGIYAVTIPSYDQTTFYKTALINGVNLDNTSTNQQVVQLVGGWRSTAALNQITVTGATANLNAGTRLVVYGAQ